MTHSGRHPEGCLFFVKNTSNKKYSLNVQFSFFDMVTPINKL